MPFRLPIQLGYSITRRVAHGMLAVLLLGMFSLISQGQDNFWTGNVDNRFFAVNGNWSLGIPTPSQTIVFNNSNTATTGLRVFSGTSVSRIAGVDNSNIRFRPEGDFFAGSLTVGQGQSQFSPQFTTARFTLIDHAGSTHLRLNNFQVGSVIALNGVASPNHNGVAEIDPNTTVSVSNLTGVGQGSSTGTMLVNNARFNGTQLAVGTAGSGTFSIFGSNAEGNFSGQAQIGFQVGGRGIVNVSQGASLRFLDASIGFASATGTLNVTGAGSNVQINNLAVGNGTTGSGTVDISNSGQLNLTSLNIAATGEVNVSNANAQTLALDVAGGLNVRSNSTFQLNSRSSTDNRISGNVQFSSGGSLQGAGSNISVRESGRLSVSGGGVTLRELSVENNGRFEMDSGFASFEDLTSIGSGVIDWTGGEIEIRATDVRYLVGNDGLFDQNVAVPTGGTLTVERTIENFGQLEVFGTLNSDITNNGSLIVWDGTLAGSTELEFGSTNQILGDALFTGEVFGGGNFVGPGTLHIAGDYRPGNDFVESIISIESDLVLEAGSNLELQLFGEGERDYDQLLVGNELSLGGIIDVVFADGFEADLGDQFDLFDFQKLTDDGFILNLPELRDGLIWDSSQLALEGGIFVTSSVPEPSSTMVFVTAALAVFYRRRRSVVIG